MKKKFGAIAAMLAVAVLLSIFTVSVFATDGTTVAGDVTTDVTTTGAASTTTNAPTTTEAPGVAAGNTGLPISQIIPLIILAVVVIVLIVVFFGLPKYREKTFKLFRSLKSEWKKVSWYSWKNTRKGTLVVIASVAALAIVIGLLDYLFSMGITALSSIKGFFG